MNDALIITSAVCKKLHAAFPDVSIYREKIQNDFSVPCFFVWTESIETSPRQHQRFDISEHIVVSYFPANDNFNKYALLNEVGLLLLSTLYSIDVEYEAGTKPLLALNPSFQIVDENSLSWSCLFTLSSDLDCTNKNTFSGSVTTHVQEKQ